MDAKHGSGPTPIRFGWIVLDAMRAPIEARNGLKPRRYTHEVRLGRTVFPIHKVERAFSVPPIQMGVTLVRGSCVNSDAVSTRRG